jgi:hypothetical protein
VAVVRVVLGALALVAAVVAAPGGSAAPSCNEAAARSAIRYAKPKLAPFAQPVVMQASSAGQVLCLDATGDGLTDMAVTWWSGGTAGDIAWLFFVAKPDGWRLDAAATGYKLYLRKAGSELEVLQPVYRKNDGNCCPTGGLDHTLYRWNGSKLVRDRAFHTKGPG